jgi:hypothetical protein
LLFRVNLAYFLEIFLFFQISQKKMKYLKVWAENLD